MCKVTIGGVGLEYERIEPASAADRTIILLHEGLGSVGMWKDFPVSLAAATKCAVVSYSRRGYGRSDPLDAPRSMRYMHDEALIVLPELLDELGIAEPVLFGHSDGASIALIHAGGSSRPVAGIVAMAPHVMVEEISVASIAEARNSYRATDLRTRLARYHRDVDGAFWGWNDVWLSRKFRAWSIEEYLPRITCPILAIQGEDDEYGTMEQVERIARSVPGTRVVKLRTCGHSPHRDQPAIVLDEAASWIGGLRR
ncbi:MAG TPA: alpha/beta hydrolase [Steroidobacteraceae bacterium]|nr:alpha/beta hydrolase [Steroidobacteraceae bacterium]